MEPVTATDSDVKRSVWAGAIPIQFTLAPSDVASEVQPEPFYVSQRRACVRACERVGERRPGVDARVSFAPSANAEAPHNSLGYFSVVVFSEALP